MPRYLTRLITWWRGYYHWHVNFENGWQCSHLSGKQGDRTRMFCQCAQGHFGPHRYRDGSSS